MLVKTGVPVFFCFAGKGTAKEQRIFWEILVGFSNVVCIEWIYIYGHVIILRVVKKNNKDIIKFDMSSRE